MEEVSVVVKEKSRVRYISPHTIFHSTSKNQTISTRALTLVTMDQDSTAVFKWFIDALKETPLEFEASNTAGFKLIPFQNHAIGRDGLMELITRQNDFLHHTIVILVVNGGNLSQLFESDALSVLEMAMKQRAQDGMHHFDSGEPGRPGQYNFCVLVCLGRRKKAGLMTPSTVSFNNMGLYIVERYLGWRIAFAANPRSVQQRKLVLI